MIAAQVNISEEIIGPPPRPYPFVIAILFITLLAGYLRFADLEHRPAGLFRDEAEKGYNAWAIATTGGALQLHFDDSGRFLHDWQQRPWSIAVMQSRTPMIYQYVDSIFVRAFGLGIASTRMASALVGTLTVLLLAVFVGLVWGRWAGVAAALGLAISPWHLPFSRWALEGIFVPFFMVFVLIGLHAAERRRAWGWPLAGAAMGLLFYSYSGAQPFVLAWGFCILLIFARDFIAPFKERRWPDAAKLAALLFVALILFIIPVLPLVVAQQFDPSSDRMSRIAIWTQPGIGPLGVAWAFIKNYCAHFSPHFLFIEGDASPRHGVPGMVGVLNVIDIIFVPLGILWIFATRKRMGYVLIAAALCGPIPAALTREGIPHALRSFAMAAPLVALSAIGMTQGMFSLVRRAREQNTASRALAGACFLIVLWVNAGFYDIAKYWTRAKSSPEVRLAFEDGERAAWQRIAKERKPGQRVFVNLRLPYVMFHQLFYLRPDPRQVARDGLENDDVVYFYPNPKIPPPALLPGDWIVDAAPLPESMDIDPLRALVIGEAWVEARQK